MRRPAALAALAVLAAACGHPTPPRAATPPVPLTHLGDTARGPSVTVVDDTTTAASVKFYDVTSGVSFVGRDTVAPFEQTYTGLGPGRHTVEARRSDGTRVDATFTVGDAPPPPPGTPAPDPTASDTPTPTPTLTAGGRVWRPADTTALRDALTNATAGDVIMPAPGVYTYAHRFTALGDGTPTAPITLTGGRDVILQSTSPSAEYGLWILGDRWLVEGITVRTATKGIVLDGSVGTTLRGVEVYGVGQEGVHFRSDSSGGRIVGSSVHDTGLTSPQYGEGIYVGSANSNWASSYTDPRTGQSVTYGGADGVDRADGTVVEDNTVTGTPAEGVDGKEGTTGLQVRGNRFTDAGTSGKNSADSAVDVKGVGTQVVGNTVTLSGQVPVPGSYDGLQVHDVWRGAGFPPGGSGTAFQGNAVDAPVPGFGIGLYAAAAVVPGCQDGNSAPRAAKGVIGVSGKAVACR